MGLRSIQPYALHRVLRQLDRYQTVPYDEDLSQQIIELCPKATFPEERVRQIWHQCRFLEPQTQVRDLSMGEVGSNYAIWYGKKSRVDQELEQPAKRPHVQQFTDGAREQWVWLAKEKEYRTTINKLEEQIEKIKFDSSLQATEDEGEKKRLARENEALRAQIQRMKIAVETPVRSERDEKIITNLRRKVHDYGFDLTKAEKDLLNAQAKLAKSAEEHARLAHQLKQKYDKEVAILQKKLVALENEMVKQIKDFKTEREHCYALIYQLQESLQQLQDQNNTDTQVLEARARIHAAS
ncbi:uncharacterized protein [Nicotiana tomentosiformis]|uniref:uncharacterized protein n=1 Tax=Nicotiana tomentosiformis TaxID=4098 RepID=UPI00388C43EA